MTDPGEMIRWQLQVLLPAIPDMEIRTKWIKVAGVPCATVSTIEAARHHFTRTMADMCRLYPGSEQRIVAWHRHAVVPYPAVADARAA